MGRHEIRCNGGRDLRRLWALLLDIKERQFGLLPNFFDCLLLLPSIESLVIGDLCSEPVGLLLDLSLSFALIVRLI